MALCVRFAASGRVSTPCSLAVLLVLLGVLAVAPGSAAGFVGNTTQPATATGYPVAVDVAEFALSGLEAAVTAQLACVTVHRGVPEVWPGNSTLRVIVSSLEPTRVLLDADVRVPDHAGGTSLRVPGLVFPSSGQWSVKVAVILPAASSSPLIFTKTVRVVPAWLSITPPLISVLLAFLTRSVAVSLLAGIWLGAWILHGNLLMALLRAVEQHVVAAVATAEHSGIMVITFGLGGLLGIIGRSGGTQGVARALTPMATTSRRGQLVVWTFGLLIFFSDYANPLMIGASLRSVMDALRVSREKFALIVDATSAPICSIAFVSSWIGFEVNQIAMQFDHLGLSYDPYLAFLNSILHRYYPLLMLAWILATIVTSREFGPMLAAEQRARTGKLVNDGAVLLTRPDDPQLQAKPGVPQRARHLLLPVVCLLLATLIGIGYIGMQAVAVEKADLAQATREAQWAGNDKLAQQLQRENDQLDYSLQSIVSHSSATRALIWATVSSTFVAAASVLLAGDMTRAEVASAWSTGLASVIGANTILPLAWALGNVTIHLNTAGFVIGHMANWMPAWLLPASVFLVCATIAFATGTSWGAMTIAFPIFLPLANSLRPGDYDYMVSVIASILSGGIWGDHVSVLSDTTVLTAFACCCDLTDHVKTQMPYALLVGAVSVLFGAIPVASGAWNQYIALLIAMVVLMGVLYRFGREIPEYAADVTREYRRHDGVDLVGVDCVDGDEDATDVSLLSHRGYNSSGRGAGEDAGEGSNSDGSSGKHIVSHFGGVGDDDGFDSLCVPRADLGLDGSGDGSNGDVDLATHTQI